MERVAQVDSTIRSNGWHSRESTSKSRADRSSDCRRDVKKKQEDVEAQAAQDEAGAPKDEHQAAASTDIPNVCHG